MPGTAPTQDFDRSRVSVILGVTGTLELVIPLGRAGSGTRSGALLSRKPGSTRRSPKTWCSGFRIPTCPGRRTPFPDCWGTWWPAGSASSTTWAAPTASSMRPAPAPSARCTSPPWSLTSGKADMVVTGGIDTFNDIFMYMCFSKTPALSPTGNAKPFDACRRRHDPRRRARDRGAEAAGRRRAGRRHDLCRHPRRRLLQRRQGGRHLRPQRGRTEEGPARRLPPRRSHPREHRHGRGPRHRHQGRRCRRSERPARGIRRRRSSRGARSDR